jgi:hypothetical protein
MQDPINVFTFSYYFYFTLRGRRLLRGGWRPV